MMSNQSDYYNSISDVNIIVHLTQYCLSAVAIHRHHWSTAGIDTRPRPASESELDRSGGQHEGTYSSVLDHACVCMHVCMHVQYV